MNRATSVADETDPDFREEVRAACNRDDAPPDGCIFPWCLCDRYPVMTEGKGH